MTSVFGTPPPPAFGAPHRLISAADLLTAVEQFTHPRVTLTTDGDSLTVTDGDAATTETLPALARAMTTHRVEADGISEALACWVEHRPVNATDLSQHSYWVLDWEDPETMTLRWALAVLRDRGVVLPAPNLIAPAETRRGWHHGAAARSAHLTATVTGYGPVHLLSTTPPELSTALLFNPASFPVDPFTMEQNLVVVSPGTALAVGERAVMQRLVAHTSAPAVPLTMAEVPARPVPVGPQRVSTRSRARSEVEHEPVVG